MFPRFPRWLLSVVGLLAVAGCLYPVRDDVDHTVYDIADHLIDPEPLPTVLPFASAVAAACTLAAIGPIRRTAAARKRAAAAGMDLDF